MSPLAIAGIVAALVFLVIISEVVCAVAPILLVMTLVPPSEREGLAEVLAAADTSRRPRLWRALRIAVAARQGRHIRR
jgi:putative exporter of polyketide antibiotics